VDGFERHGLRYQERRSILRDNMATLGNVTLQATAVTWGQFAGRHLWAAAHFAREAHRLEEEALKTPRPEDYEVTVSHYVVASVFASVASAEAYAGEVAVEPGKRFPHLPVPLALSEVAAMLGWSSVLKKYRKLADLADGSTTLSWMPAEEAALDDLILLRNKLVHFQAEPPWARSAHNDVKQRLSPRFAGSRIHVNADFFPNGFESYECAKWCVETARAFIVAFATHYGWPIAFLTKPVHAKRLTLP
jgi:hypothetical protein